MFLPPVILENEVFRLILSPAGTAESLVLKKTGRYTGNR